METSDTKPSGKQTSTAISMSRRNAQVFKSGTFFFFLCASLPHYGVTPGHGKLIFLMLVQTVNKKSMRPPDYRLTKRRRKSKRGEVLGIFVNSGITVITPHTGRGRETERRGFDDNTIYYAGREVECKNKIFTSMYMSGLERH